MYKLFLLTFLALVCNLPASAQSPNFPTSTTPLASLSYVLADSLTLEQRVTNIETNLAQSHKLYRAGSILTITGLVLSLTGLV